MYFISACWPSYYYVCGLLIKYLILDTHIIWLTTKFPMHQVFIILVNSVVLCVCVCAHVLCSVFCVVCMRALCGVHAFCMHIHSYLRFFYLLFSHTQIWVVSAATTWTIQFYMCIIFDAVINVYLCI